MGRPGLTKNRKFLRLAKALQPACGAFAEQVARGALELLWDTAYESGEDRLGDSTDVEAAARWEGSPGVLCKALAEAGGEGCAGFIEPLTDGLNGVTQASVSYRIHDLFDHAPEYVRRRRGYEEERKIEKFCDQCASPFRSREKRAKFCSDRCRVAHHRGAKRNGDVTHGNEGVTHAYAPPAPTPAPAPQKEKEQKPRAREADPERPAAAPAAWDQELLNELRVAFRATELTDQNFAGFLDSSLRFPKAQREEAARAFLQRGCATAGKGYGYLLAMIRSGAARAEAAPKAGSDDAGRSPIPDAEETQRMLAELRRPMNPPPRLRGTP